MFVDKLDELVSEDVEMDMLRFMLTYLGNCYLRRLVVIVRLFELFFPYECLLVGKLIQIST